MPTYLISNLTTIPKGPHCPILAMRKTMFKGLKLVNRLLLSSMWEGSFGHNS